MSERASDDCESSSGLLEPRTLQPLVEVYARLAFVSPQVSMSLSVSGAK